MTKPAPDGTQRYVKPWGKGLLHWLDYAEEDASRRLLVHLILSGKPVPLNIAELAQTLSLPANVLAKAMFALNRDECISVLDQASEALGEKSWLETGGLSGVEQDMASVVKPRQGMLLASEDGLLIASVGVSAFEAAVLAVQVRPEASSNGTWSCCWLRVGTHRFVFMWSHELDVRHVGLLKMGARLLLAAGETRRGLACECQ